MKRGRNYPVDNHRVNGDSAAPKEFSAGHWHLPHLGKSLAARPQRTLVHTICPASDNGKGGHLELNAACVPIISACRGWSRVRPFAGAKREVGRADWGAIGLSSVRIMASAPVGIRPLHVERIRIAPHCVAILSNKEDRCSLGCVRPRHVPTGGAHPHDRSAANFNCGVNSVGRRHGNHRPRIEAKSGAHWGWGGQINGGGAMNISGDFTFIVDKPLASIVVRPPKVKAQRRRIVSACRQGDRPRYSVCI